MDDNTLKMNDQGVTKPSSAIMPSATEDIVTMEQCISVMDTYFSKSVDPEKAAAYKKGEIFSLKDDFDFYRFLKGVCNIFEESMIQHELTTQEKLQVRQLFNIRSSCVDMLKTINIPAENINIILTMVKHCTSSVFKYNKSYVRSR